MEAPDGMLYRKDTHRPPKQERKPMTMLHSIIRWYL
jgi:hypothetical protein